jgi:hypothetical protein
VGESTSLTFEISSSEELTGVSLTNQFPSGLVVATPNQFIGFSPEGACSGGNLKASSGSGFIYLSGATVGGPTMPHTCTFSINVSGVTAGLHENLATFLSDQGHPSTSTAFIRVDRAATTIEISSTAAEIALGEPVTFTAKVAGILPAKGTPTGRVTFRNGSTVLGAADLSIDGVATFSPKFSVAGEHSVFAAYEVDRDHAERASVEFKLLVNRLASATAVMSSADHVIFGVPITLTAKVTSASAAPTGQIAFSAEGQSLGTSFLTSDGTGSIVVSELPAGHHLIMAIYSGDGNLSPSRAEPLTQVVAKVPTTIAVSTSSNKIIADEPFLFTFTVSSINRTAPSGTVILKSGPNVVSAITLSPPEVPTLTTRLGAGTHHMTAEYSGDTNHLASGYLYTLSVVDPGVGKLDDFRLGAIILFCLLIGVATIVLRRFIGSFIRRLIRFPIDKLVRPVLNRVAAVGRRLRFFSRGAQPDKPIDAFVGLSVSAISAALTETDAAIAKALGDQTIDLKPKRLLFCRWLNPADEHNPEYERERAEADVGKAIEFLKASVPTTANHLNLYDDIEGAFIAELFGKSDPACFYVLTSFRKAINSNVVALATVCTLVVYSLVLINIAYLDRFDFYTIITHETAPLPKRLDLFGVTVDVFTFVNKFVFAFGTFLPGYLLMATYFYLIYGAYQRHNGQQMDRYLGRYLGEINGHFQKIHRNASQAVVEERKDLGAMQADAVQWITNLQWMAFRVFFIECFLRNILFQARRNTSFTMALVPISILLVPIIIFGSDHSLASVVWPSAVYDASGFRIEHLSTKHFLFITCVADYSVLFLLGTRACTSLRVSRC